MRRELSVVGHRVLREARRQVSTRSPRRGERRLPPGHVRATVRRVPVVARIDRSLQLEVQARASRQRIREALTARSVPSFWLDPLEGPRTVLCLREQDRPALAAVLAEVAGPAWYAESLQADGLPTGRVRPVVEVEELGAAPGVRVWEYVTADAGSTFVAAEQQGLTVHLWRPDPTAGGWRSLVTNLGRTALPGPDFALPAAGVGQTSARVAFPVDVVYTWVDGQDAGWQRDLARLSDAAASGLLTERAHHESRFADHDELRHSLRALQQFAPWVNHVWVVTADQHPSWLSVDDPWVTVVPHRALWGEDPGLPTFNSHAIETCLHRIPGLAEHFLYLNDDMVLGRPLAPETFFHPNGLSTFFWSRALVDDRRSAQGDVASTTAARKARALLEERYGVSFSRKFFHTAAALTVSGLTELESTFPDVVAATRASRFRTVDDVAMAGSLYLNWAYVTGRSVPGTLRYSYIDPAASDAPHRLRALLHHRALDAFCINDGTSAETPEQRRTSDRRIREFLGAYLPVPGSFEVDGSAAARSKRLGNGK